MKKTKQRTICILFITFVILISSCENPVSPPITSLPMANLSQPASWSTSAPGQYQAFDGAFLQTFDMEKVVGLDSRSLRPVLYHVQVLNQGMDTSRATIPVWSGPTTFVNGSLNDYPEIGLTTDYTVVLEDADQNVYRINSVTRYPAANTLVDTYTEEYFVKDVVPLGTWDGADYIVDQVYDSSPLHREKMEILFDDGTIRYERILKVAFSGDGFEAFSIDSSLNYPDFSYPLVDADASFSSVVMYSQQVANSEEYWFWEGSVSGGVLGIRFYTEHFVNNSEYYKGTMVAYERAIETFVTVDGTYADQLVDVFVGSEHTTLAESVLRKEVLFAVNEGVVDPSAIAGNTVMRTHVVDTSGDATADFLIQQLNDDATVFSDWDNAMYHIPSGSTATEIEDIDTGATLTIDNYVQNPDGAALPLTVSSLPADTDLALLYTSIASGTGNAGGVDIDQSEVDDFYTDNPEYDNGNQEYVPVGSTGTAEFDGEQGFLVDNSDNSDGTADPALNPGSEGTVEAWVYVVAHANYAGIVHKGTAQDFSDEGYTLQFWGKRGKVAFGVVDQSPYTYSLKSSRMRLNTGKWYYLVGRWDSSKVYLDIYYEDGSGTNKVKSYNKTNSVGAPYEFSGPLVVGSQYQEGYGSRGYYGFNGLINGVVVSDYAKSNDELTDYYTYMVDTTGIVSAWPTP